MAVVTLANHLLMFLAFTNNNFDLKTTLTSHLCAFCRNQICRTCHKPLYWLLHTNTSRTSSLNRAVAPVQTGFIGFQPAVCDKIKEVVKPEAQTIMFQGQLNAPTHCPQKIKESSQTKKLVRTLTSLVPPCEA